MQCPGCGRDWPDRRAPLPKLPPHCGCGAIARPGVVWFGEPLGEVWAEAEHAAREAKVVLVVGTSAVVYPAASLAPIAKRRPSGWLAVRSAAENFHDVCRVKGC